VFVELPEVGRTLAAGDAFAVVESVKAVSDVYAAVGGDVIEVNGELEGEPEKINTDPYGAGWIARVKLSGGSGELLDADAYTTFLEE
ncbi:MAG: glycine cleavage system protein H, partial [Mariprofundaceae bacterium]|nr:glycine cleavage system protein H [Mariprofundaceae bacterium]